MSQAGNEWSQVDEAYVNFVFGPSEMAKSLFSTVPRPWACAAASNYLDATIHPEQAERVSRHMSGVVEAHGLQAQNWADRISRFKENWDTIGADKEAALVEDVGTQAGLEDDELSIFADLCGAKGSHCPEYDDGKATFLSMARTLRGKEFEGDSLLTMARKSEHWPAAEDGVRAQEHARSVIDNVEETIKSTESEIRNSSDSSVLGQEWERRRPQSADSEASENS